MNVVGFAGWSGSGKTTLVEQLVGQLKAAGQRVSVVKHAHHEFDIDQPGKDSYRHRTAGAYEVLIASDRRLALMREQAEHARPDVHALLAELDASADWVLVEGFKRSDLPKIEIWRADLTHVPMYPDDPHIVAVATDAPDRLPTDAKPPALLALNDPASIAGWLLQHTAAGTFIYSTERRAA